METHAFATLLRPETVPVYTQAFKALGHPVRLQIVCFLVTKGDEGANVSEIKAQVRIPDSTLSHHLEALRHAQLLGCEKRQQWLYYRVQTTITYALVRLLTACC